MSNIPLKRPKLNETEEDLLKFQEEFLKSGGSSSAILVDKRSKANIDTAEGVRTKALKEKIDEPRETKKVKFADDSSENDDILIGNSFTVTEKETSSVKVSFPVANVSSFPKVFRIDQQTKYAGSNRKSIFAQQMQSRKEKAIKEQNTTSIEVVMDEHKNSAPKKQSNIIDGSGLGQQNKEVLAVEIHEENLKKLKEMPIDEILDTQKNLLQTLDPNIIAFFKSRKKLQPESLQTRNAASKIIELPMEIDSTASNQFDLESSAMSRVNKDELPIDLSSAKQWLNMDKVEIEKLEWMTNLPVPIDENLGGVARFDFEGNIILDGNDIPVHQGLHHHGDQPEYPGYTLEELFRLSQSSLLSQKTLGLATLGKIILKCHEGHYDKLLNRPLLPDFVAGYVIPMLRVALDDNTPQCITASVAAIHALIVSTPDELSLDETFLWHRGEELPFSQVEIKPERNLESGEIQQESELSDVQLVELDIIKGFLRMDLLPRLRYILEVLQPPAQVVIQILDVLAKIARHSWKSANLVFNTPRLLTVVFKQFCPTTWYYAVENLSFNGKLTSLYGIPTYQAIKLLRVLSSAGRNIASNLLSQYNVMEFLLCYLSSNYQDHKLPAKEAMMLCLECLHSWQVFLHYGFTLQSYRDFYPLIMKHLTYFQNICLNVDGENHSYDCDYAASWIKLLSVILRQTVHINGNNSRKTDVLDWSSVVGLIDMIEFCLIKWMWEIKTSTITRAISRLIATSLNFISNYFRTWSKQASFNAVVCFERLEKFVNKCLLPFISTSFFENMLNGLRINSILLGSALFEEDRSPSSLPSLNSVAWGGSIVPVLQSQSSFSILTDLVYCINVFNQLQKSLFEEIKPLLLENSAILAYLNGIILSDNENVTKCWFARFEIYFLYNLINLCASKKCNYMSLYHNVSLKLLHLFQKGDEVLLQRLISLSIFNAEFIRELNDATLILDSLKLEDDCSSADILQIKEVSHSKLIGITSQNMPHIQRTYQSLLTDILNFDNSGNFDSLSKYFYWQPLLREDFIYYPIITKYRQQLKHNSSDVEENSMLNSEVIQHCLQLCHLYECLTKRTRTSPNLKYCYLSMAFMISSDIFLNSESRVFLEGCIQKMSFKKNLLNLNLKLSLEGGSFNDFFTELLNQFEATSYGDHLFGMMILIAMQRSHSVKLRGAVWLENTVALSLIGVTIKELLVPLRYYLEPVEDDENILASYFKALLIGNINWKRNPVLYLIAIHHLHTFLFDDSPNQQLLKEGIAKKLLDPKCKALAHHVLCYIKPETNSELGFKCSENPSSTVSNKMDILTSKTRSVRNN